MKTILTLDVGGTAVKMGLIREDGSLQSKRERSVSFDGYRTPILQTVIREAEAYLQEEDASPAGIGVSATGQVDDREGVVIGTNGAIPGYEGTPFRRALEERFGVPVRVQNDANAAVLGECYAGRGRDVADVLMVTLGTGVGGGVVSGGRLMTGARGIAGELGHFQLDPGGEKCTCGRRGCFERYASVSALVRSAGGKRGYANGREIFSRAAEDDPTALGLLSDWIGFIAAGLIGLTHIFNPSLILIGGGVSTQEQLLIAPLREKVMAGVMPRFAEGLRLEAAMLGNDAGIYGAAALFLRP